MRPVNNAAPIGIFDSGLGGLTVAAALARALPHESLIYVGDTARCPYGPREGRQVRGFVAQIGTFLARRGVKLIVIACNTAAAAGLSYAQTHGEVPVIGVIEPGARAAVRATRRRRVGVIGTEGTIASGAYGDAIAALDAGVAVSAVATPAFVDLVEEGLSHSYDGDADKVWLPDELYSLAGQYLAPLRQADIDVLVLGCTHYPVIARPIADIMGGGVRIISSAEETAREVAGTLARRGQLAPADNEVRYEFLTTGDPTKFAHLGERIFGAPLKTIEHIDFTE